MNFLQFTLCCFASSAACAVCLPHTFIAENIQSLHTFTFKPFAHTLRRCCRCWVVRGVNKQLHHGFTSNRVTLDTSVPLTPFAFVSLSPSLPLQIMGEILQNKIQIYEFPDTGDEEDMRLARRIKVCLSQLEQPLKALLPVSQFSFCFVFFLT